MKQWCALYVFLYSYIKGQTHHAVWVNESYTNIGLVVDFLTTADKHHDA